MVRFFLHPKVLAIAHAAMWVALIVLVWLQFRWSAELASAYEQRMQAGLVRSAASLKSSFQDDLTTLTRALEANPDLPPASALPYRVYRGLDELEVYDGLESRYKKTEWPQHWDALLDELYESAEDLATATPRRWYLRPWTYSANAPVLYRAISTDDNDSNGRGRRIRFVIVQLPLDEMTRYFNARQAQTSVDSITVIRFTNEEVFRSGSGSPTALSMELQGPWRMETELQKGTLDQAVRSLRIRNLSVGLAVCVVLLGGILLLLATARRAEQLSRMQTEFVAGFSHELRTPVTAIQMLAGNLKEGVVNEPPQVVKYGDMIFSQSDRLKQLIEDILGFAAGRTPQLVFAAVNVPELIESVLEQEAPLLKGFVIEKHFDPDLPMALADKEVLKSCISNLLSNAAKYARQGNWLRISLTDSASTKLTLEIADRGPGIPQADQHRVFEPFFRSRSAKQASIPGSGLGLHLVRTRIEAMGGSISVRSIPGEGATFIVQLRSSET